MKKLIYFLFELGHLRRIKHEGWRLAGVDHPESVAEHSLRAAQIGYFLAHLEGFEDPHRIVSMIVFHDIAETRIGDIHKVAARYLNDAEEQVVEEQLAPLEELGTSLHELWTEREARKSKGAQIARDADLLEQALCGKEYMEQGITAAEDWLNNVEKALLTESGKDLLMEIRNTHSTDWWKGLKHFK